MATRKNIRRTSRKTNRKTGRKGRASTRKNMKKGGIKILGIKFGPSMKPHKKNKSSHTNTDTFSFDDIGMGQQESFKHTNYKSDAKDNMYRAMSFKSDALKSKPKRASKR
jgi:hypothetical protein